MIKVCNMFLDSFLHSTRSFFHIEQKNTKYGISPLNILKIPDITKNLAISWLFGKTSQIPDNSWQSGNPGITSDWNYFKTCAAVTFAKQHTDFGGLETNQWHEFVLDTK